MQPTRAIAFGLLALGSIAGTVTAGRQHRQIAVPATSNSTDPLGAELVRCRDEGATAANDAACQEAWVKNRARSFGWHKWE